MRQMTRMSTVSAWKPPLIASLVNCVEYWHPLLAISVTHQSSSMLEYNSLLLVPTRSLVSAGGSSMIKGRERYSTEISWAQNTFNHKRLQRASDGPPL